MPGERIDRACHPPFVFTARKRKGKIRNRPERNKKRSSSKGDASGDARSFDDRDDRAGLNLRKGFRAAARPADFETIGSEGGAHAEMDASVVLAQIAGAGSDLANLCMLPDGRQHFRADGAAVAPAPYQAHSQRVLAVGPLVPPQLRRLPVLRPA